MYNFINCRNYIIINDLSELSKAKSCNLCRFIVYLKENMMYIWTRFNGVFVKEAFVLYDKSNEKDVETTGFEAYMKFYNYCGEEAVEEMKHILRPIPMWESYEQLHYANYEYAEQKLYQPIYEFDANSSFTYGATKLPAGFEPLKEYMLLLFDKKKNTTNKAIRSRYKNLQNYLVGYFARIKDFIRVRSDIILQSNLNIRYKMAEIVNNKGKVFLSNTDSIITDEIGAEIMEKYTGNNVGEFKLETSSDKLYYKSPNSYQIGEKIVYSGVKYFSRKHFDFFKDISAVQIGELVEGFDFLVYENKENTYKLCKVKYGEVKVVQTNAIGEVIGEYTYTAQQ